MTFFCCWPEVVFKSNFEQKEKWFLKRKFYGESLEIIKLSKQDSEHENKRGED